MVFALFIDLHGVLVNSKLMVNNYKDVLVNEYKKCNIPRKQAIFYHETGLNYFLNQINEIKKRKLINNEFMESMRKLDNNWDNLMNNFIPENRTNKIKSREIEFSAGAYSNCLYSDAISFLDSCISKNNEMDFYICSNSHTAHIKGILHGSGHSNFLREHQYIGWDKTRSLKNKTYYFERLKKFSTQENNMLICNSDIEIINAKKIGFKTILVLREYSGEFKNNIKADIIVDDLKKIFNSISSLI